MTTIRRTQTLSPAQRPLASVGRRFPQGAFRRMWQAAPWLTATGAIMLADAAVCLVGLALDPTRITGAPAWLKPLKFAASVGLYTWNVGYLISRFTRFSRSLRWLERTAALALLVEIVLIDLQAARHTTSHFNFSTRFDATVFQVMGAGISILALCQIALLGLSLFDRQGTPAWRWTTRIGFAMALAGMFTGVLMALPTPQQLAAAQGHAMQAPVRGAHTVGAPDGGPGLPVVGWSADHGDLRVAHFAGLHTMTLLTIAAVLMERRRWPQGQAASVVGVLGASSAAGFALLLWQALRGEPLLAPDAEVTRATVLWAGTTLLGLTAVVLTGVKRMDTEAAR